MNAEQKKIHLSNLVRIDAAAIRHGLLSVTVDKETRSVIDKNIRAALNNERIPERDTEHDYSSANTLIEASEELVALANGGPYPNGLKIRGIMVRVADAVGQVRVGGFTDRIDLENQWQQDNLEPLIERAFHNQGVRLVSAVLQ